MMMDGYFLTSRIALPLNVSTFFSHVYYVKENHLSRLSPITVLKDYLILSKQCMVKTSALREFCGAITDYVYLVCTSLTPK